jgi:hypothetical protein
VVIVLTRTKRRRFAYPPVSEKHKCHWRNFSTALSQLISLSKTVEIYFHYLVYSMFHAVIKHTAW